VRIGVCSDIHGHADRLELVIAQMRDAGVDERWCLGDLVGGPDVVEVVRLVRKFDLCLMGNHDAWMLMGRAWPADAAKLRGKDALWLASLKPLASRHGVRCWHGSPSQPLFRFFDTTAALEELFDLAPGTTSLVGHTHVPIAYARHGQHVFEINPEPGETIPLAPDWAVVANPGPVGGEADARETRWLELDLESGKRSLRWHGASSR